MRINLVHARVAAPPAVRRSDVTGAIVALLLAAVCVLTLAHLGGKEPSVVRVSPQTQAPVKLGDPAILHHHGLNTAASPAPERSRAAERFHHR